MSRATARTREIARRLADYSTRSDRSSGSRRPVAPLVVAELRPHMANLMGNVGFRALLSRSLVMARTEAPWLQAVRVKGDGTLEGFDELADQVGRDDFFNGNMVLLAQLLGLLSTFIGEGLTMRMMRDVWPALSFTDLNPGNGDAAS